jgi:hypothetical protein
LPWRYGPNVAERNKIRARSESITSGIWSNFLGSWLAFPEWDGWLEGLQANY